ncbi:hypothetical protein CRG98_028732 [Punica granatum]|uniref:Uncharacterized protein n=1 Tax=Punica granatum TaxID=22663 RepID=A0A2I0J3R6_PUNGR|nr:hypothetical protein CRG98_028732 [Punica granatum]
MSVSDESKFSKQHSPHFTAFEFHIRFTTVRECSAACNLLGKRPTPCKRAEQALMHPAIHKAMRLCILQTPRVHPNFKFLSGVRPLGSILIFEFLFRGPSPQGPVPSGPSRLLNFCSGVRPLGSLPTFKFLSGVHPLGSVSTFKFLLRGLSRTLHFCFRHNIPHIQSKREKTAIGSSISIIAIKLGCF